MKKILVINGSPKGKYSITLHTALYLQKKWSTSMKMYLVGWMMNNKKVRSRLGNKINEGMVAPYADLLKDDK